jgi:deferrochelatase/peroxidase EfeB
MTTRSLIDDEDTQGLLRFGYGGLTEACYVLARVRSAADARSWLETAPVTNAVELPQPPDTAMQIAFTASGLAALGVPPPVVEGFSHEFVSGMTEPSRSRRLGDVGANAPAHWAWGNAEASGPHLAVMLFAKRNGLDALKHRVLDMPGWKQAFDVVQCLGTADLEEHEPFGFKDGISQPDIDWERRFDPAAVHIEYSNRVALGEFLLGYRNEYGKYTERPLVFVDRASKALLAAEDAPERKDVGRNGTYLVMRQLRQDVRGFWRFVSRQAGGDWAAADRMAAAMVGRTRNGDPLAAVARGGIEGVGTRDDEVYQNRFTFDDDPLGVACPLGAHIRRSNPRNCDYVGRPGNALKRLLAKLGFGRSGFQDDLVSSVRFHRILRRGREYGSELPPAQALEPPPPGETERGLHFICLNANLSRQFEFVQNAWTMNARFSGLSDENDPVVGNRTATAASREGGRFTMPADGHLRQPVSGIPEFVTVRGGAYFFLPGIRALRYFAAAGSA